MATKNGTTTEQPKQEGLIHVLNRAFYGDDGPPPDLNSPTWWERVNATVATSVVVICGTIILVVAMMLAFGFR